MVDVIMRGCCGLETLAWSPEYLARVCKILVALDERDPGGKWANRPGASVAEILSAWHPQTTATMDQRVQVLDYLEPRHPKGTMRLLVALLPNVMAVATPTSRPQWRDWATTWVAGVTNADYWQQIEACTRRAITACGTDAERWLSLLKHVEHLPVSARILSFLQHSGTWPVRFSQEERAPFVGIVT